MSVVVSVSLFNMSQETSKKNDRGRSRVRGAGVGQRSGSKRMRRSSDESGTHEVDLWWTLEQGRLCL